MDDLLPCPFCGGDADLDYYHNETHGGGAGRVVCVECGASTSGDDFGWMTKETDKATSKAQAVAAWNTRTASDGRAEGLREAAEICRLNAVQSVSNDAMPEPVGDACWSHVGQKYAAMILARAAELEGKTDE
jgi:Lar family restriction alleviation protein